jgi:hypothetical protein
VYWSLVNKVKMRVLFILRIIRNLILDVKVESSSLEVLEDISGASKWTLKEPVYIDNVLCVEVKGMSDVWDCVLKETTGTTSSTRVNSWGTVCDFGTENLRVCGILGAGKRGISLVPRENAELFDRMINGSLRGSVDPDTRWNREGFPNVLPVGLPGA